MHPFRSFPRPGSTSIGLAAAVVVLVIACGGKADGGTGDDGGGDDAGSLEAASPEATEGDSASSATDGTPTYTSSCTPLSAQTGTLLDSKHGRMDGYLTYVVPQDGAASCNGDDSHVHLQVRVEGLIYDVAVDIGKSTDEVSLYEADMAIPQGAWSEGWHDVGLSYPQLGLHSPMFTTIAPAALGQKIQAELANANHVSVFGDSYSQGNGCHDVHYENGTGDGALVINPLSPTAHILFFRFSTPTF